LLDESLGPDDPFSGNLTGAPAARVHPLMVIHPLTYISPSNKYDHGLASTRRSYHLIGKDRS